MSPACIFGLEWELALGWDQPKGALDRYGAFGQLREAVCLLSPWLPDRENERGIFTPYCRFYLDTGEHPEAGSAEVSAPEELLRVKAGMFHMFAQALERARLKMPGLVLLAANHAYGTNDDNTWGNHENYAIRTAAENLARGMIPFLASRVILAGSGKVDRRGRMLFSPRSVSIRRTLGGSTVSNRALFSTCRNEPLMRHGPFSNRLHLINGDMVRSDLSEYLKVATTALTLLWLQDDPAAADDLQVRSPIRLLRAANCFWRPPGKLRICPAALAMQEAYCQRVSRFVERRKHLPDWCGPAAAHWEETLAALRCDPLSLTERLDPFIKLALFDATLADEGSTWSDIAGQRRLHDQLALLDMTYHRLGPGSLFAQLALPSAFPSNGMHTPAEVMKDVPTRAALRAEVIAQHSGQANLRCSWSGVEKRAEGQWLDLSDPTLTKLPEWSPLARPTTEALRQALRLYERGHYEKAGRLLRDLVTTQAMQGGDLHEYLTYFAWVQTRRGQLDGPGALEELSRHRPLDFRLITDYVYVLRFQGLLPAPGIEAWIERGLKCLEREGHGGTAVAFLGHVGHYHLRREETALALKYLEQGQALRGEAHPRLAARLLADLGETQRRLGRRAKAEQFLAEAEAVQEVNAFQGDLAEFTWPYQAKLASAPQQALELLERSLALLTQHGNRLGETRVLLVQARLSGDTAVRENCRRRVEENRAALPSLAKCPFVSQVLNQWRQWTEGEILREGGDQYWGL